MSCPLIFHRDDDDESLRTTPPHTPPSTDTSNVLHKSSRIGPDLKRSYDGMQSRYNGTGRPRKKYKYIISPPSNDTIDKRRNGDAATNVLTEVVQEPANNTTGGPSTNLYPFDTPLSNSPTAEIIMETTPTSAEGHSNNTTALHTADKDALTSEFIPNCRKNTTHRARLILLSCVFMSHCTVFCTCLSLNMQTVIKLNIFGGATYSNMSARILNPLVTVHRYPVFDVIRRVIPVEVLLNAHRHYLEAVARSS